MSGLANLRALRIIRYRNDDTCQWVLKETRRFIVDNLSHHPAMRLEWISIEDDTSVSRVIRPPSNPRPAGSTEEASTASNGAARKAARAKNRPARTPVLPMPAAFLSQLGIAPADLGTASVKPSWSVDSDDSESDEDEDCLHLELVEGIQFYDVWGVRIFEKEIMAGRL